MPSEDDEKRRAAREVVDIVQEISDLLVGRSREMSSLGMTGQVERLSGLTRSNKEHKAGSRPAVPVRVPH